LVEELNQPFKERLDRRRKLGNRFSYETGDRYLTSLWLCGMHPMRVPFWFFVLWFWSVGLTWAEDPIVVHYSDPSLTRLEKQLGITAAQRDRFDDIVVKYRDPLNPIVATNGNQNDTQSAGGSGQKHGRGAKRGAGGFGGGGGGRRNISRQELDELAAILTPEQLKQFQELKGKKGKRRGK
jgi:Spy/CpxP family protein refolding chaperone